MKRGQLLTLDFAMSMVVFLTILLTMMTLWSSIDFQIKDVEDRRDMQTLAVAVSDALVKSPGNPLNWTNDTVQSIGLAGKEERILSLDKILKLKYMMDTTLAPPPASLDYDGARSRLRLGNYDLVLYFKDYSGQNITSGAAVGPIAYYSRKKPSTYIPSDLSGQWVENRGGEPVWDFYWGNDMSLLAAKNWASRYNYTSMDSVATFNQMVANRSAYKTIIIENIDPSGLASPKTNRDLDIAGLQDFVDEGGILIVVGQGAAGANVIDENFTVFGEYNPSGWGELGNVTNPGYLLWGASAGDVVNFTDPYGDQSKWLFHKSDGMTVFVSTPGNEELCMICSWEYGRGTVYYLNGVYKQIPSGIYLNTLANLAIVGKRLNFGREPTTTPAVQTVNVKRMAIVEGMRREPVNLEVRVWK